VRKLIILLIAISALILISFETINTEKVASSLSVPREISWLAAGDSYSSGQGLSYRSGSCGQGLPNKNNLGSWPFIAAKDLPKSGIQIISGTPTFVACASASTQDFYLYNDSSGSPEWNSSMGKFDLVSFTLGADNINLSNFIDSCVLNFNTQNVQDNSFLNYTEPKCPTFNQISHIISNQLNGSGSKYGQFLSFIANNVVNAGGNIVILGYPLSIEDPNNWTSYDQNLGMCQGISQSQATELRQIVDSMNSALQDTVKQVNDQKVNGVKITFVNPNNGFTTNGVVTASSSLFEPSSSDSHGLCSAHQWVNGITPILNHTDSNCLLISCASFIPNQEGNIAMATLFDQVLANLSWSNLTQSSQETQNAAGTKTNKSGNNNETGKNQVQSNTLKWSVGSQISDSILTSVSCPALGFCIAVDENGNAYTFSNNKWSSGNKVSDTTLYRVSCPTVNFCMAVDFNGNAYQFSEGKWSHGVQVSPTTLYSISCPTSGFCVATDGDGFAYTFSNNRWSSGTRVSQLAIEAVACPTAYNCIAVDYGGNSYVMSNNKWSSGVKVSNTTLESIACPTISFCVAGNFDGEAFSYSNGSWSPATKISNVQLYSISCSTASYCLSADETGNTYDYVNGSWTQSNKISASAINSVSCFSESFCAAVDYDGRAFVYSNF
jgi:hypothetical protein